MKTAVITGATGAIGRALINICINAGYEVLAVVHRNSSRADELGAISHCTVLKLDLNEYEHAVEALKKQKIELDNYELFFHLAWMSSFGKERENVQLQLENIQASLAAVHFANALGCRTFIGAGSQAEYGRVQGKIGPDTPAYPETGYGIAKLSAGHFTRLLCEQMHLSHIWCRILSVYGPYDREQTLISTAVRQMLLNEDTAFTPCDQMWDYIYADDAAKAILLAAEKGETGKNYVIGSGIVRPLKEYIEMIAELTNYSKPIGFGKRGYNDKQVMYLKADIVALQAIGFTQKFTFREGISRTIAWMKHLNL